VPYYLEVATPTPRPFQAAAAMLLPGEVTATALLATYLWRHLRQTVHWSYPVSALSGVHLPGKTTALSNGDKAAINNRMKI